MVVALLTTGCFGDDVQMALECTVASLVEVPTHPVLFPCYQASPCDIEDLAEALDVRAALTASNITLVTGSREHEKLKFRT